MSSLNVSLPQSLKDYVADRVKGGGYATPSEYLRELLRDDQKRQAQEALQALLLEGIHSGDPIEPSPQYWARKRRRLRARHAKTLVKRPRQ